MYEYEDMTPYQLGLHIQNYNQEKKIENDNRTILAYNQAYWTIQWLGKRKPDSIEKILGHKETTKSKNEATPQELLDSIKKLNAALGGDIS